MSDKKVLITGINGFAGSHLSDYILENNLAEVHGIVRGRTADMSNLEHIKDKLKLSVCDITDAFSISRTIEEIEPDYIFHLAAQSFVPESWISPIETLNTNIMGSLNLFEAVRKSKKEITVQIAGSSEEYGLVKENEVPIKETNPLRPLSPYGVSKVAMDLLAYQYNQSYGTKIIRTRCFNHTGPRRGDVFVCSDWSKQIAEIETGKKTAEITVGNLEAKRDFSDVRDVVRAYWLAVEKCTPGDVYNICSESTIKMRDILEKLMALSDKKIEIKQDPKKMRPSDVQILLGDCNKFKEKTGWKPEISFDQTLEDTLNYWREKIA